MAAGSCAGALAAAEQAYEQESTRSLISMSESHSISFWIDGLRAGEGSAAGHVWNAFVERLVTAAARQLGPAGRRIADGEDVAAEAFASFFRRIETGHFPDLRDRHA